MSREIPAYEIAQARARIDELLKSNNEYQEEARAARRERDKLQWSLNRILDHVGEAEMAKVEKADKAAPADPSALFGEKPSQAMLDVFVERRRHRLHYGYTVRNDDKLIGMELLRSAVSRSLRAIADWNQALKPKVLAVSEAIRPWPETLVNYRRTLIQAAALIVAEVDRDDRAAAALVVATTTSGPSTTPGPTLCNIVRRKDHPNAPLPRTCEVCGLGPCRYHVG